MNVLSSEIRAELRCIFDVNKPFWRKGVGDKAQFCDLGYSVHSLMDLRKRVDTTRAVMAKISRISLQKLPTIHTSRNGRHDCDNFALRGCATLKALHDADCREGISSAGDWEYAIWRMARADADHTQALCLTQAGFYIVEFITGDIVSIREDKPEILLLG